MPETGAFSPLSTIMQNTPISHFIDLKCMAEFHNQVLFDLYDPDAISFLTNQLEDYKKERE